MPVTLKAGATIPTNPYDEWKDKDQNANRDYLRGGGRIPGQFPFSSTLVVFFLNLLQSESDSHKENAS